MHIRSMSLTTAKKSDEVMAHLHLLRHEHGWFKFLLESNIFNSDQILVLLALEGGRPVGVLYAHGLRVGIFVEPARRRQGIGTLLMDEAHRLLGKDMSVVLDDEASTRFFASMHRDMRLRLIPGLNPDWAPEEVLAQL